MGPGWLLEWGGRTYVLAACNRDDSPLFDPVTDLHLYEANAELEDVVHRGVSMFRVICIS